LHRAFDTNSPRYLKPDFSIKNVQRRGSEYFYFELVWKLCDRFQELLWERLTYLARRIDSSTVRFVLRGSTAGSVQKAS
jgi:hypothetical protein